MKNLKSVFSIVFVLVLIASCKKDEESQAVVLPSPSERVLVSCEGAFGNVDASISSYDTESQEAIASVFEDINGYNPGDVLQSMTGYQNKLYLVVNNSAVIEVVDMTSLIAESPITGLISPRAILPISDDKAYVSNIFSDNVQIVDLSSKTVEGSLDIGGWSEGMISVGDKIFVSRNNGDKVMVIDGTTDLLMDSITVGEGPLNMVLDSENRVWVLTNGNFGATTPVLVRIDPLDNSVLSTIEVPAPWSYQMALRINSAGDKLYVLNNGVYTMSTASASLGVQLLEDNNLSNYGLGIDPMNGDIYLGFTDFNSVNQVFRYNSNGTELDQFEVGKGPNGFYFGE